MRCTTRLVTCLIPSLALSGCSPIGSNVLVFGTETKVAIDASGDPTGQPSFTIGYKRREAVWLPLSSGVPVLPTHVCVRIKDKLICKAVGKDRMKGTHICLALKNASEANAVTTDNHPLVCESIADVRGYLYAGTSDGSEATDAYSVMANFGLDTSSAGGAKIAQYIATGIAARNLTKSSGAALVNSEAAVTGQVVQQALDAQRVRLDAIVKAVVSDGKVDKTKLKRLAENSNLSPALQTKLEGLGGRTEQELRDILWHQFPSHLKELARVAQGGL